jgi:hypothetical protein
LAGILKIARLSFKGDENMKRAPFWGKLRLLLLVCCSIILAVLIYRQYLSSTRLNSVLRFEKTGVDKCLMGLGFYGSKMTEIKDGPANAIAEDFVGIIRKCYKGICDDLFGFGPIYKIVFERNNSIWQFEFTAVSDENTLVAYKTTNPSLTGTIFLEQKANSELVALIESFVIEEAEKNQE